MQWNLYLIGFILSLELVGADHQFYQRKFRSEMLHETGVMYQSLHPTAPITVPGLSGAPTPEEIAFNKDILNQSEKCVFQGESSVEGEEWVDSARRKKVSTSAVNADENARHFIQACLEIKRTLGKSACSVVEIAGHAEGYSIGLGEIFGLKVVRGKWKKFPQNDKLFLDLVQCLRDISKPTSQIVFSSCGAGAVEESFPVKQLQGRKLYYPNKFEAQQLMSNLLGRTVYSARGAENVQEWGKHCRDGWCRTEPLPNHMGQSFEELLSNLPEPRSFWDSDGNFTSHEK